MAKGNLFSSMSMTEKRERLMALVATKLKTNNNNKKKYEEKARVEKEENGSNEKIKRMKVHAHEYKKMFRNGGQKVKMLDQVDDINAKESCSGSKHERQRVGFSSEGVCLGKRGSAEETPRISSMDGPVCETVLKSGKSVDIQRGSTKKNKSDSAQRYEDTHTHTDMETNADTHTSKETLSPFTSSHCKFNTTDIKEYWVPVHLSSTQIEQYCSILYSNMDSLSSCARSSLHNILTETQKCCDHPYLVDPTLRNSSRTDTSVDPLDAEINVSGKLQVLDKLLLEIKRRGLKVLVLFQPEESSRNVSIGDMLDDLVHQKFGQESYVRIPGRVLSRFVRDKRKEDLKLFNSVENKNKHFVCLFDYRACHPSVQLSHVDVVLIFNSDWNPSHDIKSLQKITFDPHCKPLRVFRLYSSFTVEEKALIFSKKRLPLSSRISHINWTICHQVLAWGASYLVSELESQSNSKDQSTKSSFIVDLVHEFSSMLRNTGEKTCPTNRSIISNAEQNDGSYSENILLLGETAGNTKESSSVDEHLIENRPPTFWKNLLNECHQKQEKSGKKSGTDFSYIKTKPRSKRKVCDETEQGKRAETAFETSPSLEEGEIRSESPTASSTCIPDATTSNSRINQVQKGDNDQPTLTSSSPPLETEIKSIQKEREQVTKLRQEKKSTLASECEKELLKVRKKYDLLIQESEMSSTKEMKNLEEYQNLVSANKLLAEILEQNFDDPLNAQFFKKTKKETSSIRIREIPVSALVRPMKPYTTSAPSSSFSRPSLRGTSVLSPAPHLRSNPSLFGRISSQPPNHTRTTHGI